MRRNSTITIVCSFLLVTACQKVESPKATDLIEKALNEKIESFKENKRNECYASIYMDAEMLVDSIIAQQLNLDTIDFPNKPLKPRSPNIKEIPKEFILAPIK